MPALLTRTSTCPNSPYAVSTSASRASHRPTCAATGSARRPVCSRTSAAAFSQLSRSRLAMTTSAPAAARPSTISRPRPRLPPVTRATLPDEVDGRAGPARRRGHAAGTGIGPTTAAEPSACSSSAERPSSPVSADVGVLADLRHAVVDRARVAVHVQDRPGHRAPSPRTVPASVDERALAEVRVLDDVLRVVDRRGDDLVRVEVGEHLGRAGRAADPVADDAPAARRCWPSARRWWRTSGRPGAPGGPSPSNSRSAIVWLDAAIDSHWPSAAW